MEGNSGYFAGSRSFREESEEIAQTVLRVLDMEVAYNLGAVLDGAFGRGEAGVDPARQPQLIATYSTWKKPRTHKGSRGFMLPAATGPYFISTILTCLVYTGDTMRRIYTPAEASVPVAVLPFQTIW